MKKVSLIICIMVMVMASAAVCYGDGHGYGRWHGGHRDHGFFGVVIAPAPYFPYPAYAPPPPPCEKECRERVVPTCRYDRWGERWCHDEVVLECRRVCY